MALLAQAQDALDRERFDDARRIATQLLRELPDVAAVHEVLGLASYRSGRWKQAATALEAAQQLHPTVELLPVLADVYRAQRRWADVERIWEDVPRRPRRRKSSPRHASSPPALRPIRATWAGRCARCIAPNRCLHACVTTT